MSFFNIFKKKNKNKNNIKSIDKNNIKNEEIELLKRLNGNSIDYEIPKYWSEYIHNIDLFIENMIKSNLLRVSTPKENVEHLKVNELKMLLDKKHLNKTGKKDILIERVRNNYTDNEIDRVTPWNKKYSLTTKGEEIVKAYTLNQEKIYNNLIIEVFNLVQKLEINKAYTKIANYENNKIFKRGMGIDWAKEARLGIDKDRKDVYEEILRFEFSNSKLAVVAICGDLLGLNSVKTTKVYKAYTHDGEFKEISDDNLSKEIHYIQSTIYSKLHLKNYLKSNIKKYTIMTVLDDNTCEICGEFAGKVLDCSKAKIGINFPPFHKSCRCCTRAYIE